MRRWTYLIPRILILLLAVLAVWMGRDSLVKRAIIHNVQRVTNAKCEIGHLQTSFVDGQIYLQDLRIADPRDPMRNLLQADSAYLQLDLRKLWYGEVVIRDGKTRQILFGSPRTEPGNLGDPVASPGLDAPPVQVAQLPGPIDLKQAWLDRFQTEKVAVEEPLIETRRLVESLQKRWTDSVEGLENEIAGLAMLRQQTEGEFQNGVRVSPPHAPANPLRRDYARLQQVSAQTQSLRNRLKQVYAAIDRFETMRQTDTEQLLEAARREMEAPPNLPRQDRFNGEVLSELLLADLQEQQLQEIIDWFTWFRRSIPDPAQDFRLEPERGRDLILPQAREPGPRLLVHSLELTGEGRIAGQYMTFTGVAENVASDPSAIESPATFRLRADGNQQLMVHCTVDRGGAAWEDDFKVTCSELQFAGRQLGNDSTLRVTLGDHQLAFQVELRAAGDELDGTITFRHSSLLMHVDSLHPLAGGREVALRANREIATVEEFTAEVQVAGTVDQPVFRFQSDLGDQLALALNEATHELAVRRSLAAREQAQQELVRWIDAFNRDLQSRLEKISRELQGEQQVLNALADRVASEQRDTSAIR